MTGKPLTEKDIVNTPIGLSILPFILPFVWVKDVQSAKRLFKQRCFDETITYPANKDTDIALEKALKRVHAIFDACFQIPDGDDEK